MKVKALRGVCVGVEDDMKEGDVRDLDPATADYFKSIGAVADAPDEVAAEPGSPAVPSDGTVHEGGPAPAAADAPPAA